MSHPEFVLVMPSGRTIIVAIRDEDYEIVDLLLVAAIDVGNGRATWQETVRVSKAEIQRGLARPDLFCR